MVPLTSCATLSSVSLGLIREGLGRPDVVGIEIPPGPIADAEGADHLPLNEEGNRQHRLDSGLLHAVPEVRRDLDPRIVQDIRGDNGATFVHRQSDGADPGRQGEHPVIGGGGLA